MVSNLLNLLFLKIYFEGRSPSFEVFVKQCLLHFITEDFYLGNSLHEAFQIRHLDFLVVFDDVIFDESDILVVCKQMLGNSPVELFEVAICLQVVPSDCIECVSQERKEQVQQVYQQKKI